MSSPAALSEPMEAVIARLVSSGATGCLEINQGQKRWLLFFSGGALIFSRSNLKTEQLEAVREKAGEVTQSELFRLQATRRLRNICRLTEGTHQFHEGQHPPQVTPVNVLRCLREAVIQAYGYEGLTERASGILREFPRVAGEVGGLGLDAVLEPYLQDVDGSRIGSDVVSFAPSPPEQVLAALWLIHLLGDLELSPSRQRIATVLPLDADGKAVAAGDPFQERTTGRFPAPELRPAEPESESLDVSGLLAEVIASAPAEPSAPPAAAARPHAPPPEHPMAPRLRRLAQQIGGASNHFERLGLPWDSDPADFRKAYTDLARDLHPDRYHDAPDALRDQATDLFDSIRSAWEVLGNDAARAAYIDVAIHGKKTEEELAQEQLDAYWAADEAFKKGITIFRNGRVREAHDLFRVAAEAQPDELEFQAWFGYTTFSVNRSSNPSLAEDGLGRLRDVLERNKGQERQLDFAWVLLGRACREKGELEAARKALIQALRINPSNDDASREMRRLDGEGGKAKKETEEKKLGFFASLFGKKK